MPQDKTNRYKEWLDTSVQSGTIYCCPKSDIRVDPRPIGIGAFGMVQKATVKRFRFPKSIFGKKHFLSGMTVAVKTLILATNSNGEDLYGSFVRELKNHRQANSHPNIIRFLGLCKDKNDDYHMIFELADGGTLREYLDKHFRNLSWKHKYKLGLEIVDGLRHIHSLGIVHKDLSSKNILIQLGIAKITDFGLSSVLKQMSPSHGHGALRYKDPTSFRDESYRRGKKSDMFSLGVILWEISTGKIPCGGRAEDKIITCRLNGYRDPPIVGTPKEYVDVYSECWDEDPDKRPFCENVHKRLKILEYRDALDDFNRMLELEPNDVSALKNRGVVYLNLEKYDEALHDFNKSLTFEPDNALTLSKRGTVYTNLKKHNRALIDFNRCLVIEPTNAYALRNRGRVYLDLKRHEQALRDLSQSLKIEPSDTWALSTRGAVYLHLERYNDALNDFNASLKIKPNDAWALSRRGGVYLNLRQYDKALEDFNNSLDINPDGAWALSGRGAVYYYCENYEDALKDFSKSLEIEPSNTWTLSIRAAVYINLKQHENASKDIQKSLEIEPDNTWTLSIRKTVLLNLRQDGDTL